MEAELADFRQRLEDHHPDFTKSQQHIASYLLASYDEAAFLPAADLARRLGVSEATLVRFAQAIGYDGFRELRRSLQALYRVNNTPASRLKNARPFTGSASILFSNSFALNFKSFVGSLHSAEAM